MDFMAIQKMFFKKANTEKNYGVVGNFNLNCLDYIKSLEIQTFQN